jgi:hypothetical protein
LFELAKVVNAKRKKDSDQANALVFVVSSLITLINFCINLRIGQTHASLFSASLRGVF